MTTPTPGLGNVHVTQEQLTTMATRCTTTAENISTNLTNLIDRIQALSGSGMSGQANVALQNSSAQLNGGLRKVIGALNGLAEQISSANVRLGAQDEEAAQMINNTVAGVGDQSVAQVLRG